MINIYDKIIKNLNVVLFYRETTILLSIDQNFYDSVSKLINICNYIEMNEKTEVKQTPDYILLMETITEKKLIIEELKSIDLSKTNDELDNMKNIVKNAIKKDIEEISLILKKELIDKLDKKENIDIENSNNQNDQVVNNDETSFNSNSSFEQRNANSINQIANSMIEQQAQTLMLMDMNNGKLYRYTTKPKIIPIIKKILLILIILLAIFLLVSNIITLTFSAVDSAIPVFVYDSPFSQDSGFLVLNNPNNVFSNIFVYLGIALIGFSVVSSLKNSKTNENIKYFMRISTYIMPIFFFLVISSFFTINGQIILNWTRINQASSFPSSSIILDKTTIKLTSINEIAYSGLLTIFVLTIVSYGIIVLILLLLIVSHNYKPKEDFEKLNSIRQNYINDIKSGKIDMSDPGMFQPPRRFPF